jgi:hypothetical protein
MKKIIIAPLFTMLVVSCGTVLPSQSENSLISEVSSSGTSSPSTPSSSEEPVSNRKVPFNQIGSLVAQVVDAKAMGIVNSKDRVQPSGRRNAQGEDQNYIVKVTETYNPNTQINEDQTIQVTFTRVNNTQSTELQTGTATHVATADPITIERATYPGNIVITNVIGYEFRLLSGETIVEDWMSSDLENFEFIFDEALTDIVIESRSLNASISFTTFEDFTYTIKQGDQVLYEDILDNDLVDNNAAVGAITISGLTEGLAYDVTYAGNQVIETITQDEVDGQVDKLFVLYQYTFISFVPLNLNPRPQDQDLELDYDDIPLYDKTGFYSDSTRQSFVVDNNTGLIYKIEGINIASLSGGCVAVQDNPFPFDIRITEADELEFFSLHQNASITTYSCLKDKYGNKFVRNNRLNLFSSSNNTTFYVDNKYNGLDDSPYARETSYWLTNRGEIIKVVPPINRTETTFIELNNTFITSGENTFRLVNHEDEFLIFQHYQTNQLHRTFKIIKGFSYSYQTNYLNEWQNAQGYGFRHQFWGAKYSLEEQGEIYARHDSNLYNTRFLETYDLLIEYRGDGKVIAYHSFFESLNISEYLSGDVSFEKESYVVIEDITYENGQLVKYDLIGKQTYDIVAENTTDGLIIISAYLSGTYIAPPTTSVTLQPINR